MTEQEKRTHKARLALERGQFELQPLAPGAWRVINGEGGTYAVRLQDDVWACTCPDFTDTCRPNGWTCKHIEGVRLTAGSLPHKEPSMTLNVNHAWTTLTGRTLGEVIQALKAVLPPAAYKPVPGSQGLTDIDPSYLTEKATELFGPAGLGWFWVYEAKDLEVAALDKTRRNGGGEYTTFEANLLRFALYFRYLDADGQQRLSEPILATGGNTNENRSYAIRGALTNALGAAFAKLCWQLPVYQGLLDHKNAGQQFAKAHGGGQDQGANGAGQNGHGAATTGANGAGPGKKGAQVLARPAVEPAGAVCLTFGTKAHPEFKGQVLAEVVKSADGRDLVRYLAGPQWAADTDEKRAIKRACEALAPTLPAEAPAPAGQPV